MISTLAAIAPLSLRAAALAALAVLLSGSPPTDAGHEDGKVLVLAPPLARADAFWMAQSKGFFGEQQLKVSVKWMAGGADALRVFREGREGRRGFGDFVVVSEVSAVDFWQSVEGDFVVIAALARDAHGYVGIAKAEISGAEALKRKAVATRLGSTSAWLLGEYLRAHRMSERDVALKNESPEAILSWNPAESAVAAFFVREPYGTRVARSPTELFAASGDGSPEETAWRDGGGSVGSRIRESQKKGKSVPFGLQNRVRVSVASIFSELNSV